MDLCAATETDGKAVAAAGEALATLHAQSPAGLECWTRAAERAALLAGYEAHRELPERIGLYTAVEVFRRSRFPFRVRERDWRRQTEALIGRAEAILGELA